MFKDLFNHIKNHKRGYSLGVVAALFALSFYGYYGTPGFNDASDGLAGRLTRGVTSRLTNRRPVSKPVEKPVLTPACTESDWSCTELGPVACPANGQRARTCTLMNKLCTNSDAVKPAEVEACQFAPDGTVSIVSTIVPAVLQAPGHTTLLALQILRNNDFDITSMKFDVETIGDPGIIEYKIHRGGTLWGTSSTPSFVFNVPMHLVPGSHAEYFTVSAAIDDFDLGEEIYTTLQPGGIGTNATIAGLPIAFEITERECTSTDFSCSQFAPEVCPASGQKTRTCTQHIKNCVDTNNAKPAETEACEYVVADADASALMTYATVGRVTNVSITLTLPTDLANGDTIDMTFPNHVDVTNLAYFTNIFGGSGTFACAASGQEITCTANGPITAGTGELIMSGVFNVYVASDDITNLKVEHEGNPAKIISTDSNVPLNDSVPVPITSSPATVTQLAGPSTLTNGTRNLITFSVTAHPNDTDHVVIPRMDFDLDITDADNQGELGILTYKLYRGSTFIASSDTPSITFDAPETITAGTSQIYSLKADVAGTETDDTISTSLPVGGLVTSTNVEGLPVNHVLLK